MSPALPTLGPFKRYVTGHDPKTAQAVHIRHSVIETELIPGSKLRDKTKVLFTTTEVPVASNSELDDGTWRDPMDARTGSLANDNGTVLRVVDFPPHEDGMMHRTSSVDYGIVLYGEITHVLDSGERVVLKAGDVMVQRGTMHQWNNEGNDWCRVIFVLQAAKPAIVNGHVLSQGGFKPEDVASGGK